MTILTSCNPKIEYSANKCTSQVHCIHQHNVKQRSFFNMCKIILYMKLILEQPLYKKMPSLKWLYSTHDHHTKETP